MNRRDLVRAVSAHTGQPVKDVDAVVAGTVEVITAVVSQGETVSMPGFAKFTKVERPARMGRNPATGETIRIKASKRARITALKAFKESVLSPSKAPKLARGVWPTDPDMVVKKAAAPVAAPTRKTAAKKTTAKRTSARKTTARKTTAKKRATATRKSTARKSTARKAPARKKATAARRPAATKRAPARRTTARKSTGRRATRR